MACSGCASRLEACAGKRAGPVCMVPPTETSHLGSSNLCYRLPPIKACVENCIVPLLALAWSPLGSRWGNRDFPRQFYTSGILLHSHRLMCPQPGASMGVQRGGRKPLMPAGSSGQMFPLSHVGNAPGQSVPRVRWRPWQLQAQPLPWQWSKPGASGASGGNPLIVCAVQSSGCARSPG